MNRETPTKQTSDQSVTTLYIASDHAGFELKEVLKKRFPKIEWQDLGPTSDGRVDYPDFADALASRVKQNPEGPQGILVCGSGQGMAIRANRYPAIRAALVWDEESTRLARAHNDVNVLCLGGRLIAPDLAEKLIEVFLSTPFEGGRHKDRVDKLNRALC